MSCKNINQIYTLFITGSSSFDYAEIAQIKGNYSCSVGDIVSVHLEKKYTISSISHVISGGTITKVVKCTDS